MIVTRPWLEVIRAEGAGSTVTCSRCRAPEILELLNNLVKEQDVGILYITHDLLSARMLADQVIVLNEGQIVEQGLALDVIRDPQDDYTRTLLAAIPNPFADEGPHPPLLEEVAAT